MLNPQRWGASSTNSAANSGYVQDFEKGTDGALFDIGVDEDDEEDVDYEDDNAGGFDEDDSEPVADDVVSEDEPR